MQCLSTNSFCFNSSLCDCHPGYLYHATTNICSPFIVSSANEFLLGTRVDYSINLNSILVYDLNDNSVNSENMTKSGSIVQATGTSPELLFTSFESSRRNSNSMLVYDLNNSFKVV
ncbi:hypothetical protein Lser_V15G20272 [Lactuca serriola]